MGTHLVSEFEAYRRTLSAQIGEIREREKFVKSLMAKCAQLLFGHSMSASDKHIGRSLQFR